MTPAESQMREIYPVTEDAFRYQLTEIEGAFTFLVGEEASTEQRQEITVSITSRQAGEGLGRTQSGRSYPFAWAWVGQELHLWLDGQLFVFERAAAPLRSGAVTNQAYGDQAYRDDAYGGIVSPMPGAVLEVLVSEGERVESGQAVLLLESMKMELAITAPQGGVVRRVSVQPGQQVERGMRLVELGPDGDGG